MDKIRYDKIYERIKQITNDVDLGLFTRNVDKVNYQNQLTEKLLNLSDQEIDDKLQYLGKIFEERNSFLEYGSKFLNPYNQRIKDSLDRPGALLEKNGSPKILTNFDKRLQGLEILPSYARDSIFSNTSDFDAGLYVKSYSRYTHEVKRNAEINHNLQDYLRINSQIIKDFADNPEVKDEDEKIEYIEKNRLSYRDYILKNQSSQINAIISNINKDIEKSLDVSSKNNLSDQDNAKKIGYGFYKTPEFLYNALGLGRLYDKITHKKSPEEDSRYVRYVNRLNSMFSKAAMMMHSDHNGRSYYGLLSSFRDILSNPNINFSEDEFISIEKSINDDFEEFCNNYNGEKLKRFQAALDDVNSSMLINAERLQDKESDMMKFRILQGLLLVSPLGGVVIFGEVFDFLGLMGNFLDPLFDPNLSYGQAIGEIITDKLGVFGVLPDVMELDKVAEFIFDDMPIVKEPFELFNFIADTELVQGGKEFFGLANGLGLVGLGILCSYTAWNFGKEIEHWQDVDETEKDHQKRMRNINKDYLNREDKQLLNDKSKYYSEISLKKVGQLVKRKLIENESSKALKDLILGSNLQQTGFDDEQKMEILKKIGLEDLFHKTKGITDERSFEDVAKNKDEFVKFLEKSFKTTDSSLKNIVDNLLMLNSFTRNEQGFDSYCKIIEDKNSDIFKNILNKANQYIDQKVIITISENLIEEKDREDFRKLKKYLFETDSEKDGIKSFSDHKLNEISEINKDLKEQIINKQSRIFCENAMRSSPNTQVSPKFSIKLDNKIKKQIS